MFLAPFDRSKTFVIPNSKTNLLLILILKDFVGPIMDICVDARIIK